MKKAILLFLLVWIGFGTRSFSQMSPGDTIRKNNQYLNSVYVEGMGNTMTGSFNYERLFRIKGRTDVLAFRVGGMCWPLPMNKNKEAYDIDIPMEFSVFWGAEGVKPEVGFGVTYKIITENNDETGKLKYETALMPVVRLGCRYVSSNNKFFVRAGVLALFIGYDYILPPVWPSVGLALGYSFGK
ncbi:hypothetical protein [Adhaeribacter soli]|uniref:Uncharacterized protein n=1 Tax=Adhaeribacter soli TaxID=2607655 RepID=A0A5N1IPB9_9BACT|nr:hypothetical protein [Adhaeribacter soli]KAA9331854.1 hypothetical protein F0P94_13735 [Adhaeribacter soli]